MHLDGGSGCAGIGVDSRAVGQVFQQTTSSSEARSKVGADGGERSPKDGTSAQRGGRRLGKGDVQSRQLGRHRSRVERRDAVVIPPTMFRCVFFFF